MPRSFPPSSLLACCLLTALAAPAILAYDDPNEKLRGLRDRFELNVGGFFPNFDTQVRVDSTNLIGSIIRLEQNLDLESETSNFRLDGHWRFTPRSRVEYTLFDIRRGSRSVLEEEIVIPPDTIYRAGAEVVSEFDTAFFNVVYKWSFFNKERVDTGFTVGFSILDAHLDFSAVGSLTDGMGNPVVIGDTEYEEDFTFPVPVVGQFLSLNLAKRLFYRAGFQLLVIDTSDWQGSIIDLKMALDYYFSRHVGLGLGYNFVKIEYEEQTGNPRLDVEYRFDGLMGYLSFVF
jgi:hypothetical protein